MNAKHMILHDAKVLGMSVSLDRQPISLSIKLRDPETGEIFELRFDECAAIEAHLLGGILFDPENFSDLRQMEVPQKYLNMAFAATAFDIRFTGGSSILVTCVGYRVVPELVVVVKC